MVVQVFAQETQKKPLRRPSTEMTRLVKMLRRRAEKLREQAKPSVGGKICVDIGRRPATRLEVRTRLWWL